MLNRLNGGKVALHSGVINEPTIIEFALGGTIAGRSVSARGGLPLARFSEFNDDVAAYVQGSENRAVLREVQVQIEEGSYLLRVVIPAGLLPSLVADTAKLNHGRSLAELDRHRAEVILRWQERSRNEPSLSYAMRSPGGGFAPVTITQHSQYVREESGTWVDSEHYLIGEITDWGGAQSVNVHLRVRNSKKIVTIAATADQIREQRENLVLRHARVHVIAEQEIRTGELRNLRLINLRSYAPKSDPAKLDALWKDGAVAWAGIGSATAWVEDLRGHAHD